VRPDLRKYIVSERFIHDGLIAEAKHLVKTTYGVWREKRTITPALILWLDHDIKADDGSLVRNLVTTELPDDTKEHHALIKSAVVKVQAYAFFYIRRVGAEIKALLETPHGTYSWTMPVIRSADVEILAPAKTSEDKDYLSILWTPKQGNS